MDTQERRLVFTTTRAGRFTGLHLHLVVECGETKHGDRVVIDTSVHARRRRNLMIPSHNSHPQVHQTSWNSIYLHMLNEADQG